MFIKPANLPSYSTELIHPKINQYKFKDERKHIVTVVAVDGPTNIWVFWDDEENNVSYYKTN